MNRPVASRGIARHADPPGVPDTVLRGSRLVIARVAWLVITTFTLVLSVVTFLPYVRASSNTVRSRFVPSVSTQSPGNTGPPTHGSLSVIMPS